MEINPFAILAAVLANLDQTRKAKIMPDDGTKEEIEIDAPVISLAKNEDVILCRFPMEKLAEAQMYPYDVKISIENGAVTIYFQKASKSSGILDSQGQKVISENVKPLVLVQ